MAAVQDEDNNSNHKMIDDDEESKFDDEEDPMLDEMLQKAEQLRLAMLAASNTSATTKPTTSTSTSTPMKTVNATPSPTPRPLFRNTKSSSRSLNSQRSKVSMARSGSMPAIPETIEMEPDNATECSSVGYYSIVYGSNNPHNHPHPPKKHTTRNIHVAQVVEEEEKTNEDGSVHHAFSDSSPPPLRQHAVVAPNKPIPIATNWKTTNPNDEVTPKSCETLSPLAIAPEDDEIVSVADYYDRAKSKRNQANGSDDVTWIKVAFVDQEDDDYVSLQDYSNEMGAAAMITPQTNRKQRRKILTLTLCTVVLIALYMKLLTSGMLSRHAFLVNTPTPVNGTLVEIATPTTVAVEPSPVEIKVQAPMPPVLVSPAKFAAYEIADTDNNRDEHVVSVSQPKTLKIVTGQPSSPLDDASDTATSTNSTGGLLQGIMFPGRPNVHMIWTHSVANDRRRVLEGYIDLE